MILSGIINKVSLFCSKVPRGQDSYSTVQLHAPTWKGDETLFGGTHSWLLREVVEPSSEWGKLGRHWWRRWPHWTVSGISAGWNRWQRRSHLFSRLSTKECVAYPPSSNNGYRAVTVGAYANYLSISTLPTYLSIYLSIYLYLPTYLSIYLSIFTYLPTYLSIYLFIYLSTYLPTYLPI